MKLRIVSDGTRRGTRLEDESGRVIENVRSISWDATGRSLPVARIELVCTEIDVTTDDVLVSLWKPSRPSSKEEEALDANTDAISDLSAGLRAGAF